jgi:hypothetical protein
MAYSRLPHCRQYAAWPGWLVPQCSQTPTVKCRCAHFRRFDEMIASSPMMQIITKSHEGDSTSVINHSFIPAGIIDPLNAGSHYNSTRSLE